MPSLFLSGIAYTLSLRVPTKTVPAGETQRLLAFDTSAYTLILKPSGNFILSSLYLLKSALFVVSLVFATVEVFEFLFALLQLAAKIKKEKIASVKTIFFAGELERSIKKDLRGERDGIRATISSPISEINFRVIKK